jgi:hypothetical protein
MKKNSDLTISIKSPDDRSFVGPKQASGDSSFVFIHQNI